VTQPDQAVRRGALTLEHANGWTTSCSSSPARTLDVEHIAPTKLQAGVVITLDPILARLAGTMVAVAPLEELYSS
jgi:hypothetical protein